VVVNQSWLAHFPTELYLGLQPVNAVPTGATDCTANMSQRPISGSSSSTTATKIYGEPTVTENSAYYPDDQGRSYWVMNKGGHMRMLFKSLGSTNELSTTYSIAEDYVINGYASYRGLAVEPPPEFSCGASRLRYRTVRANAGSIANGSLSVRKGWMYDCVLDVSHGGGTAWRNWSGSSTVTAYTMEQLDTLIRSAVPAKITLSRAGASKVYVRLDNSVFWRSIYGITEDITQDIWVREDKFGQITREQAAPINWSDWEASKEPTPW
jgi:hypothetical protein